jgi:hypothetical protein
VRLMKGKIAETNYWQVIRLVRGIRSLRTPNPIKGLEALSMSNLNVLSASIDALFH